MEVNEWIQSLPESVPQRTYAMRFVSMTDAEIRKFKRMQERSIKLVKRRDILPHHLYCFP